MSQTTHTASSSIHLSPSIENTHKIYEISSNNLEDVITNYSNDENIIDKNFCNNCDESENYWHQNNKSNNGGDDKTILNTSTVSENNKKNKEFVTKL